MAERFGSGGSKVGAVELRDCLSGRRGHADELAVPVRLRRHVAPARWPASLLDEPVLAVELRDLLQQPVADLGVQCRLDPRPYTANVNGAAASLPAWPAMRRTRALRIAS